MQKIFILLLFTVVGVSVTGCSSEQMTKMNQPDSAAASIGTEQSPSWNASNDPYYNDYNY